MSRMTRATRDLRASDPARFARQDLDTRAEAELSDLIGADFITRSRQTTRIRQRRTIRLVPALTTGAVAATVIALATVAVITAPDHRITEHATSLSPGIAASAPSRSLIGPAGSRVRTRAQLHAYVQETFADVGSTNATMWEQQQWLAIQCMADAGYLYDPITYAGRTPSQTAEAEGLTAQQQKGFQSALGGPGSTTPYNWRTDTDWRNAGCIGRAVHTTQQDQSK